MSQLFHVTTMTIVCSTRFCTSASLLWLWMASTLTGRGTSDSTHHREYGRKSSGEQLHITCMAADNCVRTNTKAGKIKLAKKHV